MSNNSQAYYKLWEEPMQEKVDGALLKNTPIVYEVYDTDFVKKGFDVRQIVRF